MDCLDHCHNQYDANIILKRAFPILYKFKNKKVYFMREQYKIIFKCPPNKVFVRFSTSFMNEK